MATNRELLEQAEALGKQLGVPVQTQGLSSAALADLVTDLQKKAATASEKGPSKPRQDGPQPPPGPVLAQDDPVRPPYAVAKGYSISSAARGVLGEGTPIGEADVGGVERLERLVQLGRLVKA